MPQQFGNRTRYTKRTGADESDSSSPSRNSSIGDENTTSLAPVSRKSVVGKGDDGLPQQQCVVDVCDRDTDTFEFLEHEFHNGRRFVIRSSQNRIVLAGTTKKRSEGIFILTRGVWHGLQHVKSKLAPDTDAKPAPPNSISARQPYAWYHHMRRKVNTVTNRFHCGWFASENRPRQRENNRWNGSCSPFIRSPSPAILCM